MRTKEEIIDIKLTKLLDLGDYNYTTIEESKQTPEYKITIESMQDYADEQAVAFTEWVSFCVFSGMYFEHRTEYGIYFDSKTLNKITTAELLEIFKKEQQ